LSENIIWMVTVATVLWYTLHNVYCESDMLVDRFGVVGMMIASVVVGCCCVMCFVTVMGALLLYSVDNFLLLIDKNLDLLVSQQ
jgi:hypothetical protein